MSGPLRGGGIFLTHTVGTGLPVVKTTVSLLSHVRAKKIILAAASAHSIDHLSCSAQSLITLVGAEY